MRILAKLIPLFIIIPLIELWILIEIGKQIGVWETIGLVILTGVLGAFLVQFEGMKIWIKLQAELMQMKMPTNQLIDGVLILIGGIVLLTPGVITDLVGLTLILPITRPLYRSWLKKEFGKKINVRAYNFSQSQRQERKTIDIIEGPKT